MYCVIHLLPCCVHSSKYPEILKELVSVLNKEEEALVKDQVCAAVCRMMFTRPDAMPLDQVY